MSKNNQKPNARGFVDRFYNAELKQTQTTELSNNLIPKKENLITQDSLKKVLKKRKSPYVREEFVNERPTPMFIINKRNPT